MRDRDDLRDAFGQADEGFKNNVYRTLAGIQAGKEIRTVKRMGLRAAIALVVVSVLLTGTALALSNTWGILDFLSERRMDAEVLPEAAEVVQKDVPQEGGLAELATFKVRESLYDGQDAYIVLEVRPSDPKYLLMGIDANPLDPASSMGPLFSDESGTVEEYAHDNNLMMVKTWIGVKGWDYSADYILESDGTLVYMLSGSFNGDSEGLNVELSCGSAPFTSKNGKDTIDTDARKETTLSVSLKNTGTKDTVASTASAVYTDCGVRVDKVTLTGSEMAIYARIEFTVIDESKFAKTDGGLWFEFLDEKGERLPSGASSSGSVSPIGQDGTRFVQEDSIRAMEELPEKIILRGYNCWEKNRYETHLFEMK